MHKGVNFNPFEYPMHRVGIVVRKLDRLFMGFKLQYQQAACFVREGAGKDDAALFVERFQMSQMRWAVDLAFCFSFGAVVADDDEFHSATRLIHQVVSGFNWLGWVFEGAAILVPGCHFMPPADFFLAQLPA